MGTAVTEAARKAAAGNLLVEDEGNISTKADDTASVCHSFGEDGGGETGEDGTRLSAGFAQQPDVQHLACAEPQHLHTTGAEEAVPPTEGSKTPCDEVATPTRTASSIVTILERPVDIYVWRLFRIFTSLCPYKGF
jgi:hypothetical protein